MGHPHLWIGHLSLFVDRRAHPAEAGWTRDDKSWRSFVGLGQVADFLHEFLHIAKFLIDARESHVGDLIDRAEALHHTFADHFRGDLTFVLSFDYIDDVFDHHADLFEINGAFVTRGANGVDDFLTVEIFTTAIAFNHEEPISDHGFGGAETGAAFEAFASAPNRASLSANPGVDYFVFNGGALRAAHSCLFEGDEILKDEHTLFSGDGLRMKLDTPDRQGFVAQAHDLAFGGFGGDLEAIRQSLAFDDQGVIASRGEPLWHVFENIGARVLDGRGLAVHQTIGADDFSSEMLTD